MNASSNGYPARPGAAMNRYFTERNAKASRSCGPRSPLRSWPSFSVEGRGRSLRSRNTRTLPDRCRRPDDLARERGQDPLDAACDLIIADRGAK